MDAALAMPSAAPQRAPPACLVSRTATSRPPAHVGLHRSRPTARIGLRHAGPQERGAHRRREHVVRAAAEEKAVLEPQSVTEDRPAYFIATNNFKIKPENRKDFEDVWKNRESHLKGTAGFIRFALLRCNVEGEYISQSTWASQADFEAWARSDKFKKAHQGKGPDTSQEERMKPSTAQMLAAPPVPKFYEAVTVTEA